MPFSKLYALLIAAGIIPLIITGLFGMSFYVFFIYNVLLIILLLVDFIITPSAKAFELERECDEKFSLGVENTIAFKVRNNSNYIINMELTDEIPQYFKEKGRIVGLRVEPHAESKAGYTVIPEKRGEFTFGKIHVRYDGVLRLCSKKGRYDKVKQYKVYPNLKDLSKFNLTSLRKSLLEIGNKRMKSYSIGTEFEGLREYNEDDDYRRINWLATARTEKLIVNTYQPEKNQQIFVMLDSSRVMNSEINGIKKLDYAINSAFLLADFSIKKGDNTGLLVFDSEVNRYVKPGKGSEHFRLLGDSLYNVEGRLVTADYREALIYLNRYQKRRSLLCLFTELFNAEEAMRTAEAFKSIARNHIPLIITIKDTRVYEAADSPALTNDDVYKRSAALSIIEEREKAKRVLHNAGIACIDIPPDELSIAVLNKYLSMKATLQI